MTRLPPRAAQVWAMADGTQTVRQIADTLGTSESSVRNILFRLRRDGLAASTARPDFDEYRAKTSIACLPANLPAEKRDDYRLLKRKGYRRDEALRALGITPST